jgi:signal transduction histidine kinase
MKPWPRTLGVQLIVVIAVAVFLSNAVVALWFELGSERLNQAELTERMLDRAASVATMMSSIPPKARSQATEALEGRLWRFRIVTGKTVAAPPMTPDEAKLAARLQAMLPGKPSRGPVAVHFRPWSGDNEPNHAPVESTTAIQMTLPVVRNTQLVATFIMPPGPPWPAELSIAAVVSILVASVAGAYIARRVARPLSKLADAASVAAMGETAPRVPEVGPEDVQNAARAFNAMMDQVSRTLESQRQLLSAVGHDLRTPITAMRINIEFVEDAELRDRLQKNLDELQDLTESVLSAARGAGGEARRQIDLASLVESVCADLDDLGEPVVWNGHDPAPLSCRANEVRRAVRNLVENAVSYGQRAEVSIRDAQGAYEVVVDDEGPGIAPEDRARVFEPFVRLEGSRNLETGGTGLGLTLVKAIAEGHGGKVTLEDRPEGGLRAVLHLPRQAASAPPRVANEVL